MVLACVGTFSLSALFREANLLVYQIDYILVTKGLLPWIKHGDIQPSINGSDHCPIYVDLHEEIEVEGHRFNLRERMLGGDPPKQPPRIATRYWDEYSGKQMMLSSFFGKKGTQPPATQKPNATVKTPSVLTLDLDPEIEEIPPPSSSQVTRTSSPPPEPDSQPTRPPKRKETSSYSASQASQSSPSTTTRSIKKQKVGTKSGQTKLSSFFATPSNQSETRSKPPQPPSEIVELDLDDPSLVPTQQSSAFSQSGDPEQLESDHQLAQSLVSSQATQTTLSNRSGSSSQSKSNKSTAASWSSIMAPLVAPLCTVHGEPTKELTVNKPGPNKGKKFYVCSRLVAIYRWILEGLR
jgi:AP endonuclease-2